MCALGPPRHSPEENHTPLCRYTVVTRKVPFKLVQELCESQSGRPLHKFNDLELFWQFRFRRADILQMTNELKEELEHLNRKGALPPVFTGRRTALNPCQQ